MDKLISGSALVYIPIMYYTAHIHMYVYILTGEVSPTLANVGDCREVAPVQSILRNKVYNKITLTQLVNLDCLDSV